MNKNRANNHVWVDYAKAIGIFLVLLAHLQVPKPIFNYISAFILPLFFGISGFLFSFDKYPSYKAFAYIKAKQLLIPYFIFSFIAYPFWVFIGRHYGIGSDLYISPHKTFLGIFYGNGNNDYLAHNVALWFLPCLFVVENIHFLLIKNRTKTEALLLILLLAFVGYLDYRFKTKRLPWGADVAIVATVFYSASYVFKAYIVKFLNSSNLILLISMVSGATIYFIVSPLNPGVDMNLFYFNNYWLFFLVALSGTFGFSVLCKLLERLFNRASFIEFISRNTLTLFSLHLLLYKLIEVLSITQFGYPISNFEDKIGVNLIITCGVMILLIPVIHLYNRNFPRLLKKLSEVETKFSS